MEIVIDKIGSNNYYGEVLAVKSNYSKLVKNPRQKIRGLNSQAILLTGIAFVFLVIFAVLYLMSPSMLYLAVIIIFSIALILGIIYIFLVNRRISKFRNNDSHKKLIIEDEYVEMHMGDEQFRLNFEDMHWIILNKYSITFIPKTEGAPLIAVEIKYKNQVIGNIKDKQIIVDNSSFVMS
jgi:membrane protein implicated in regulation of membrane protease activity